MVSLEECIGMCGLQEDELDVVARHEHLPAIVAAEMANTLLQTSRGVYRLHMMFRDCIEAAAAHADTVGERQLSRLYLGFRTRHPIPTQL